MNPYDTTMEHACLPCAGFEAGPGGDVQDRCVPACVRVPVPEGRWRVSVSIAAGQDVKDALLFTGRRRLIWRGDLHAGEMTGVSALCMTHPGLSENGEEVSPCTAIELALVAPGAAIDSVCVSAADVPAVLLMGDSTVTDQGAMSPYAPGATYCGWGQLLPAWLCGSACVGNFAVSGLTVETFRTEGLYDLLKSQLRPGDLVLMQFGHNDQKRAHLTADGGYADALAQYIAQLRAMGAVPAVVTPLARNSWTCGGEYLDLLHAFARAAKRVAAENAVPVIDLHGFMRGRIEAMGRDAAKALFHVGDYTHTNDFGAYLAADFVAGELARLDLAQGRACEAWLPHGPYDVPANDQGDESLPPTGLEALYRAYEHERPDAPLTRMGALEIILRTCGLFAHNAPVALPADVPQDEPYTADIRCALQHGLIPGGMLAGGRFRRRLAISSAEFYEILRRAYGMRCPAEHIPQGGEETITRAQAAAICRAARI